MEYGAQRQERQRCKCNASLFMERDKQYRRTAQGNDFCGDTPFPERFHSRSSVCAKHYKRLIQLFRDTSNFVGRIAAQYGYRTCYPCLRKAFLVGRKMFAQFLLFNIENG
jgi:hypothetical protein